MKVGPSIRKRCAKCKIVKRKGRLYIICENPKPDLFLVIWDRLDYEEYLSYDWKQKVVME